MASLVTENNIQPKDPISLLPFKKPTRVLPCGHTFNHSSLANLIASNGVVATLPCPLCRQTRHVRAVGDYPRNYGMENLLAYQRKKEEDTIDKKVKSAIKTRLESIKEKKSILTNCVALIVMCQNMPDIACRKFD